MVRAVLWDFGGVITTSPFEAFERYERENGLPVGFIRGVNATNPDDNAWAQLERSEIDAGTFDARFAEESAAAGHEVRGRAVLGLLSGDVRPEMVEAVRRCREHFRVACLTNNFRGDPGAPRPARPGIDEIMALFHAVFESSQLGVRKPTPEFYERALGELGIEAKEAVFLDDLGINLKPARALGMHTIKVVSAERALEELEVVVRIPLRR